MKTRNYLLSVIWLGTGILTAAADTGTPPAANADESAVSVYQAARRLLNGEGVDKDPVRGLERMTEAARLGHLPAMTYAGYLYSSGKGVAKDEVEAAKWFRMAAEKGDAVAQINLSRLLVKDRLPLPVGMTDRQSQYDEGVEWMRKAADQGNPEARLAYGVCLMRGDYGTKGNPAAAPTYLLPAAEAGELDAMNALGVMHESGNGVPYDLAAAERWFRKAATAGNLKAQANLGALLGPLSEDKAKRAEALGWLYVAADAMEVTAGRILQDNLPAVAPEDIVAGRAKAAELRKQLDELAPKKEAKPVIR